MRHAPLPIGIAETPRGFLVSLPPQFRLVLSLKRSFRGTRPAPAPWTYLVPPGRHVARDLEVWIAEIEVQSRADARRRAWSASDAEWEGATARAPNPELRAEPIVVVLPRKRTAPEILRLLTALADGEVLHVSVSELGARSYRLAPSGRVVRKPVAERAIRERLVAPGNDGLFGPEWSQTWRAPSDDERRAAEAPQRRRRGRRAEA